MTEVISVKFRNRGKCYFFSPEGLQIPDGMPVIVETSKGLELADCVYGNHNVEDTAVVPPLRPVIRIATEEDLRGAERAKAREKEALEICRRKIEEHGLDMKLVDAECSFEGNKTTFFFTSDGRVDFRELVKDLASVLRNRIELRQIGVRDEAKLLGGIGICGQPYCCSRFLDDFKTVSTKMAKTQSLSLNPTKISGSCGRLMCCLRYEQEAYEELVKNVPKQGAFVQTKDGYGMAVQVNLLRQTVKVKLDGSDDLTEYKPNELAAVPGGRPKEGEPLPQVLNYVPVTETAESSEEPNQWEELIASYTAADTGSKAAAAESSEKPASDTPRRRRRHKSARPAAAAGQSPAEAQGKNGTAQKPEDTSKNRPTKHVKARDAGPSNQAGGAKQQERPAAASKTPEGGNPKPANAGDKPQGESTPKPKKKNYRHRYYHNNKGKNTPKSEN